MVSAVLRKPVHAFAAFIWVAAIAVTISNIILTFEPIWSQEQVIGMVPLREAWLTAVRALYSLAQLGAAAVLVELVDGLRWLATPEQDRAALGQSYLITRWSRSRVS
jgi:hypothetical protein